MRNFLRKVPLPISGVMLGFAALGNLLQSYGEGWHRACGISAGFILILLLLKLVFLPGDFVRDMKNQVTAGIAGTFPMALMLLSVYLKPYIGQASMTIWFAAIILHAALVIFFTVSFIRAKNIPDFLASYFIVYVGMAVASVSAPAYGMQPLGYGIFVLSFVLFLVLFVFVTFRYLKYPVKKDSLKPLFCIYTAPCSLCLAGYLQSASVKSAGMVIFMLVFSFALYLAAFINLFRCLALPFFPSYAAFTFPFVISAIAVKQTNAFFLKAGEPLMWLKYAASAETVIAAVMVLYTFVRFLKEVFS